MKAQRAALLTLGLAACVGAASLGCDGSFIAARRAANPLRTVYAPTETGLTLVYEQPTLPPQQRMQERIQLRVSAAKETPQGERVTLTYSSLHGTSDYDFLIKDGGWFRVEGDTTTMTLLPKGFPDDIDRFQEPMLRGVFRVLGRGELRNPSLQLPGDFDRIGVWVELGVPGGARQRIFYLPGIGEAESLVYRNGQWVVVNQLVSRGFTDVPVTKSEPQAP